MGLGWKSEVAAKRQLGVLSYLKRQLGVLSYLKRQIGVLSYLKRQLGETSYRKKRQIGVLSYRKKRQLGEPSYLEGSARRSDVPGGAVGRRLFVRFRWRGPHAGSR